MNKLMIVSVISAMGFLAGCVNPEVVSSKSVNDANLTCKDIAEQMTTLNKIRTEAEAGRSVSGQNVAAALIFWPAVVGNAMNASQAIEAANKREAVLSELAKQKRCKFQSVAPVKTTETSPAVKEKS